MTTTDADLTDRNPKLNVGQQLHQLLNRYGLGTHSRAVFDAIDWATDDDKQRAWNQHATLVAGRGWTEL
jgi:hypothetical protein